MENIKLKDLNRLSSRLTSLADRSFIEMQTDNIFVAVDKRNSSRYWKKSIDIVFFDDVYLGIFARDIHGRNYSREIVIFGDEIMISPHHFDKTDELKIIGLKNDYSDEYNPHTNWKEKEIEKKFVVPVVYLRYYLDGILRDIPVEFIPDFLRDRNLDDWEGNWKRTNCLKQYNCQSYIYIYMLKDKE